MCMCVRACVYVYLYVCECVCACVCVTEIAEEGLPIIIMFGLDIHRHLQECMAGCGRECQNGTRWVFL